MGFWESFIHTYSQFFNWDMWVQVMTDPVAWGLIGTLVIMEGLLSADNALVLAVMVKHLPGKQKKKALFYGLLGAYLFRFIAIGAGVFLIQITWVKFIGAAYLAWLSIKYFIDKRREAKQGEHEDEEMKGLSKGSIFVRLFGQFWGTVAAVEVMDIAFSVDSILAALAISDQIWVLLVGGMLGILMMRGVAGIFLKLIERVPELETTAYVIILFIAIKMAGSEFGLHIDHALFFTFIVVAFAVTFLVNYIRTKRQAAQQKDA
ncbi:YkoY family integral membrane protein [Bacillus oleivorans]|uniref:YkoY family integral membrane protein n=1 Tax=Bacillus oleivorans TaxID=1448271 RepID=A0A285CL39_9BACI|nr:TerC family protein [Bacillus oleivorans]SNX68260.1 YkoY family integral membrane protein [Bacillus oleivorans]